MKTAPFGKRALDRYLVATTPSRGARRRKRAASHLLPALPRKGNPEIRSKTTIKVVKTNRVFTPGGIGHLNASIVSTGRVSRRIAKMGVYQAAAAGFGDKKQRRYFDGGLACTTKPTKSWASFWKSRKKVTKAEVEKVRKGRKEWEPKGPIAKRGFFSRLKEKILG